MPNNFLESLSNVNNYYNDSDASENRAKSERKPAESPKKHEPYSDPDLQTTKTSAVALLPS